MDDKQKRFFPGEMLLNAAPITKAASTVSKSLPLDDAVEFLGMNEHQIKGKYSTYKIDAVTYVQL